MLTSIVRFEHDNVVAPYLAQYVGSGKYGFPVTKKKRKHLEFGLGKFDFFSVDMAGLTL